MTTTLAADPGRRLIFTGYGSSPTPRPGVITGVDESGALLIRLDGQRSSLRIVPEMLPPSKSLLFLDEVGPVPELPMGRFTPTGSDLGFAEYEGVPVTPLWDDSHVMVTADPIKAVTAANAYGLAVGDYGDATAEHLSPQWVVFEWQPEDAGSPWLMHLAEPGDDMAVRIHALPA